jgi:hypothetical protein
MAEGPTKGRGGIMTYDEASSGRNELNLEAEHIAPGSILQMIVRSMASRQVYTRPVRGATRTGESSYEQNTTILVDKAIADIKTDEGLRDHTADQDEIRRIKDCYARVQKAIKAGNDVDRNDIVQLNAFFTERGDLTRKSRDLLIGRISRESVDPPKGWSKGRYLAELRSSLTDERINLAMLTQLQEVWALAKEAQARGRKKPASKGCDGC